MVPDRAIRYTRDLLQDPWKSNVETLPYRGTANGGGYSTVTDLLAFANALTMCWLHIRRTRGCLPPAKSLVAMRCSTAYRFEECIERGIRSVVTLVAVQAAMGALYLRLGTRRVVLANMDPPCAQRLVRFITGRLPVK